MGKRRKTGRRASAAIGAVILAVVAAVCLAALCGWLVWRQSSAFSGTTAAGGLSDHTRAGSERSAGASDMTGTAGDDRPDGASAQGYGRPDGAGAQGYDGPDGANSQDYGRPDEAGTSAVVELTTAADPGKEAGTGTGNVGDGAASRAAGQDGSGAGGAGTERLPEESEGGDITLLFAGDVYFSDHVMNAYNQAGGIWGVLDEGIRAEIGAADIFMANQEFPFTDRGTAAEDKQFTFRVPPEKVSLLQEMGVDIVTMANNHILDFGPEGITDSLAALDGAGIFHVGVGENLEQAKELVVLEVKGKKIGFLGTSRVYMAASWAAGAEHPGVFSTYDPTLPLQEIRAAREMCDYLVVYVHWGIERNMSPEEYQRVMGRQYIDAGADLVVGSHPHVLQEIEEYNGKTIAYSLGNFVFGSSIPETELLKVVLKSGEDEEETEVSVIPCTSSGGYTRLSGGL